MKVMIEQLNPIIGDLAYNTKKILTSIEKGKEEGAQCILFSELTICGYPPMDLLLHSSFIEEMNECLEEIIKASKGIALAVGIARKSPYPVGKKLLNSLAIIDDGKLLGFHDKWLLPTYDVFDERRYFEPGVDLRVWDLCGKKVAFLICEDLWQHSGCLSETSYLRDPVKELISLKPDLLLASSASPFEMGKLDARHEVCKQVAKTLQCPFLMSCQVGAVDGLLFDGRSLYVDAEGELISLAKGFVEDQLIIDLNSSRQKKSAMFSDQDPIEEVYQALIMGVRDYFYKTGFQKACLGISGGIDSAVVACLAKEALGADQVTGIFMPSSYTSKQSEESAQKLCKNLGIQLLTLPITTVYESYLQSLSSVIETSQEVSLTQENLQSRIRGMMLMAFSNETNALVLNTSVKSEIAVGYSTLYGDMCGALSVLGDVYKTRVYELASYINSKSKMIEETILQRAPTAELKPQQLDQDTLPEYKILDAVIQGYVEERLSTEKIAKQQGLNLEFVKELIRKIQFAEYKRKQSAPILRVTKKCFRVGRSYPIAQRWEGS